MVIMGFKLYQLMLIFAFYSVAGYIIEQILYGISGYAVKRGFLAGPAGLLYGIGGLVTTLFIMPWADDFYQQVVFLLALSLILEFGSILLIRLISGTKLWRFSAVCPIICTGTGLIVIYYLSHYQIYWVQTMPSLAAMILLLLFYAPAAAQLVESVWLLFSYRHAMNELENFRAPNKGDDMKCIAGIGNMAICDHKEYAEAILHVLYPYRRWLRAYQGFRKSTVERLFRECSVYERLDIKKYMK
jgi:uncharacterized membrane protein